MHSIGVKAFEFLKSFFFTFYLGECVVVFIGVERVRRKFFVGVISEFLTKLFQNVVPETLTMFYRRRRYRLKLTWL